MAKKTIIHWTYNDKEVKLLSDTPDKSIGFIYKITNKTNGMYYIGRKTMVRPAKKKSTVVSEYPWKSYCGSSKSLLADIKAGHLYSKEIICFCFSKAEMTYHETKEILCSGSLEDNMSYNFWIKCTIYSKHLNKDKK